jgi:hypothetical protein
MAAYDNVSLPPPPNIATAGNYAQMLMQGLQDIPNKYYKYKDYQYQQQQRDLFQNGVPTSGGQLDYASMLRQIIQAGGAPAAEKLFPALISQQTGAEVGNAISGGGQPQQPQGPNTGPETSIHAGPSNITGQFGSGQGGGPATAQTSGGDTVNSLAAESHTDLDAFLTKYPAARQLLDRDLTPGQAAGIRQRMAEFRGTTGGPTVDTGAPKQVTGTGYEQDEGSTNQATPTGATGGAQISPNPQGAGRGVGETFDSRFNAAQPARAQPGARPTPIGTEAEARQALEKARQLRSIAARIAGVNPKAAEQAGKAADYQEERAKQIFESIGEFNEPGRTQRDVESGATLKAEQIKTDTERFGKQYDQIQHQADETNKLVDTLKLTKSLMDQPSFYSGAGSEFALAAKRIGVALGLANPNEAQAMEAFGKTVSSAIMDQIRSLGGQGLGQVRVAEINIMKQAAQNHDNTPASNRLLTELQERAAERWTLPIAKLAREYDNGHLDAGFDKVKQDWINKHPLLSKEELEDPRRIAPPLARTPADLAKIGWKDGMPFRTPDGQIFTHAPKPGG